VGTPHIQSRKEDGRHKGIVGKSRRAFDWRTGYRPAGAWGIGFGGVAAQPIAQGQKASDAPTRHVMLRVRREQMPNMLFLLLSR
jgi:hypothetical protein